MRKKNSYPDGGVRQMLFIAFPMLVSNACETVIIFTDRLFVAKLDPIHLNASLAGGLSVYLMMIFFIGLTGYTTALAAQYLGKGERAMCGVVLTQAVLLAVAAYPLLLALKPAAHALFHGMGLSPEQLEPQIRYFDILLYVAIFALLRNCLSSFFAGIGRTRIVMISSAVMMAVNVPLNYVLVFGKFGFPKLGIVGAAYGSIIATAIAALILAVEYLKPSLRKEFAIRRSFRFDPVVMKKLLRYGYPAGLEYFLNILAFTMMVMLFQSVSPSIATAITIVINWDIVSYVPLIGIEIGVMSLVGRFMGAERPEIAHRSTLSGIKFGLCYSAIVFVFFLGAPGLLVRIFAPHEMSSIFLEATPTAVNMLRMASLYILIEVVVIAMAGALRGAGDTLWAMILTVGLHWTLIPVLYFVLHVLGQPAEVAWFSMIMVFFVFLGLIMRRYLKGDWKKIRMIQN